ncbi:MAG: C40 family peptidase [Burkholderiaceae bacterium]|jgi:cell wall-associated NlpC family hydrolase|nr:C40 family peptidase [Burkholderiaceae bacterium]
MSTRVDVPQLLSVLRSMQGVPWHTGGRSRAGVDCVGLLIVALRECGIEPHTDMVGYSLRIGAHVLPRELDASPLLERAQPPLQAGDVCLMRIYDAPRHLAVALEDAQMIHATYGHGVRIVQMSPLWLDRIAGIWRWR